MQESYMKMNTWKQEICYALNLWWYQVLLLIKDMLYVSSY